MAWRAEWMTLSAYRRRRVRTAAWQELQNYKWEALRDSCPSQALWVEAAVVQQTHVVPMQTSGSLAPLAPCQPHTAERNPAVRCRGISGYSLCGCAAGTRIAGTRMFALEQRRAYGPCLDQVWQLNSLQ